GLLVGRDELDYEKWYPMSTWVNAMHAIVEEVGPTTAFMVGRRVPEFATLPPQINDVLSSLHAIDGGYHLNHRREGTVMFDPQKGVMLEGIGHYACEAEPEKHRARMICDNPYPCDFDRGIITAFAARFEPTAAVTHEAGACRKNGDASCIYLVQW